MPFTVVTHRWAAHNIILCIAHVWVGGIPYTNIHNPLCLCDSNAAFFK